MSDEQSRAALAMLSGQNRYQLVQGAAGSGKTTLFALLREVADKHGHEIVALTPQHRLANELRADTGLAVDTVAGFLARHQRATGKGAPDAVAKAERDIGGRIVLIDEASMLSSRQMLGIMQIVDNAGAARLVLVGDAQQISSPEAGRPFALLQEQGAPAAHLSENRRQRDPAMREAVAAARLGNIQSALDALGGKVSESASPAQSGAAAWLALSPEDRARTAIFTSGHALRTEVLDRVRAGLIKEGALGSEAIRLRIFENLNLTHEQVRQLSSYTPGQRLDVFQRQSRAGLERGSYTVAKIDAKSGEVELKRGDRTHRIKPETIATSGKGFALSSPAEIEVRAGDRLIWTTNNRELGIANGSPVDVLRIDRNGITLRDAEAIAARFGVSVAYVRKVLRLAALCPEALKCLARDEIGMEAAQALTLTGDHDRQREALQRCGNQAHSIRRMLTEEKIGTGSSLFLFVGLDAYRDAGGTITADLFAGEGDG